MHLSVPGGVGTSLPLESCANPRLVVSFRTWLKSPRISSSNRILFSLGVTKFLMLGLFLLNITYFFISPNMESTFRFLEGEGVGSDHCHHHHHHRYLPCRQRRY
ncbi:taste receptor type 2 member 4 [Meles meles]|uniref:taste receptor type 2 member 4 n=1 Tax=Meles meles TaxID=9662 RepID=UPI001E69D7F8|nr:taste receptor type 2 member 4 [Meles meles]